MKNVGESLSIALPREIIPSPNHSALLEKPLGQSPEGGRRDPKAAGASWQVACDTREGEREGDAREGQVRGGEAEEGGGRAPKARADAEGAVWGRPEDSVVCVL